MLHHSCIITIDMNKQTKIILIGIIFIIIAGLIVYSITNRKNNSKLIQTTNNIQVVISPVPSETKVAQAEDSARAKIRSEFIANCKKEVGQQYTTACNCAADYLSANYSDIELAKVYVKYHSSSQVPEEIKKAYNECKDK
jgi:hypothetical protein